MPDVDELNIKIESDSSNVEKRLQELSKSLDNVALSLGLTGKGYRNFANDINIAGRALNRLNQSLRISNFSDVMAKLGALQRIDLSNLSKGLNIDVKLNGASNVQKQEEAFNQSFDRLKEAANNTANELLRVYQITDKKLVAELRSVFESVAKFQASGGIYSDDNLANIDKVGEALSKVATASKTTLTSSLDYAEGQWEDFFNYIRQHKIQYTHDVEEMARYSELIGNFKGGGSENLFNIFSKKSNLNIDSSWADLTSRFPSIFSDLTLEADNAQGKIQAVIDAYIRARDEMAKRGLADIKIAPGVISEGSATGIDKFWQDYTAAIESVGNQGEKIVGDLKAKLSSDKIYVDVEVNTGKIQQDIIRAVNSASKLKYDPVDVKLKVDLASLRTDLAEQIGRIDLTGINGLAEALKTLNQVSANLGNLSKGTAFRDVGKALEGIAKVDGANLTNVTSGIGNLVTSLSNAGLDRVVAIVEPLNSIASALSRLGAKSISTAIENMNHLGIAISAMFEGLSINTDVSSASTVLVEISNILSKFGGKTISRAIENLPLLGDAIRQMLENIASAPQIPQSTIDAMVAASNMHAHTISSGGGGGSPGGPGSSSYGLASFGASFMENTSKAFSAGTKAVGTFGSAAISVFSKITKACASFLATFGRIATKAISTVRSIQGAVSSIKNKFSLKNLTNSLTVLVMKFWAIRRAISYIQRAATSMMNAVEKSMNFIETYHYFDTAMMQLGTNGIEQWSEYGYDSAEAYYSSFKERSEELNEKMSGYTYDESGYGSSSGMKNLGLDPDLIMNYQATFAQMSNSMGMTAEAALATSKAMTMLGADWSSMKNINFSTAYTKMESALAGQSRAVRALGIDITNTALAQTAENLGIEKKVANMSQAEKAELRMIAILQQSKVAYGDLAKTINTPANQLRMLRQQFSALARTIGNLFLPVVAKVLPYLNAMAIALQRVMQFIARLIGADIGQAVTSSGLNEALEGLDDDGALDDIADSGDDAADALDGANESAEKLKKTILGFDELNVLNSADTTTGTNTGGGSGSGTGGLGGVDDITGLLDKGLLDALADYEKEWNKAFDEMSNRAQEMAEKILAVFRKIYDFIHGRDWKGLGQYLGDGINYGLDKIYNFAKGLSDRITPVVSAITETLNSLIDRVNFRRIGQILGAGLNTLVDIGNTFYDKFKGLKLGAKLANLINGFFDEVRWDNLGHLLGKRFQTVIDIANGLLSQLHYKEIGNSLATMFSNVFDAISFSDIAKTVGVGINGVFTTIEGFTDEFKWHELAVNVSDGVNTLFTTVDWEGNAERFSKSVNSVLGTIKEAIEGINFDAIGTSLASGLNGIFGENGVDWDNLSGIFSAGLNGVVSTISTFAQNVKWDRIGTEFAGFVKEIFTGINWDEVASALSQSINGLSATIASAIDRWKKDNETPRKIGEAFNKFAEKTDWKQIGTNIGNFFKTSLEKLGEFAEKVDWKVIGEDIGTLIKNIDWVGVFTDAIEVIKKVAAPLVEGFVGGLFGDTAGGNFAKGFVKGIGDILGLSVAAIEGIATALGKLFDVLNKIDPRLVEGLGTALGSFFALSIGASLVKNLTGLVGNLTLLKPLVSTPVISSGLSMLADALSRLGPAAAVAAVAIGAFEATTHDISTESDFGGVAGVVSDFASMVEKAGNAGALSATQVQTLTESMNHISEAESSVDAIERAAGALKDAGVNASDFDGLLGTMTSNAGAYANALKTLDNNVREIASGAEEFYGKLDLSNYGSDPTVKLTEFTEIMFKLRDEIGLTDEKQRSLLQAFYDQEGAAHSVQESYDILYQGLQNVESGTSTLNQVFAQEFPGAVKAGTDEATANILNFSDATDTAGSHIEQLDTKSRKSLTNTSDLNTIINDLMANTSLSDSFKLALITAAIGTLAENSGTSDEKLNDLQTTMGGFSSASEFQEHIHEVAEKLDSAKVNAEDFSTTLLAESKNIKETVPGYYTELEMVLDNTATSFHGKGQNIGKNLTDGTIEGMKSKESDLEGLSLRLINEDTIGTMEDAAEVHSPSRRTYSLGENIAIGAFNGITEKMSAMSESLRGSLNATIFEPFSNIAAQIPQAFSGIENSIASNFVNVGIAIQNSIGDLYGLGQNVMQSLANGLTNFHIPLPAINWDWRRITYGNGGWVEIPDNFRVNWYAKGGFPNIGEMFIANENGPEMLGKMGRKNVVANNMQIVDGISRGVTEAMMEYTLAMGGFNNNSSEDMNYQFNITLTMPDGEVLSRQVEKGNIRRNDRRMNRY